MDSSDNMYEIADYNHQEGSSYQMQDNSSIEGTYQEIIENTQQAPNHYQKPQKVVYHKHMANKMISNDASVGINRAKRRTFCIAMIFLVVLISVMLTLGAVALIAVSYINQSSHQIELNKLSSQIIELTSTTERNISQVLHHTTQVLNELNNTSNEKDVRLMSEIGSLNNQLAHFVSEVQSNISQLLYHAQVDAILATSNIETHTNCGEGTWYRIAFLNMSNPSQICPNPWSLYSNSTYRVRACGRPSSNSTSCSPRYYYPYRSFNRVCGRVIGYQIASPDGFLDTTRNINQNYMDGVSICIYASSFQRTHIWSYVGGYNERYICPGSSHYAGTVNSFVGSNYYCESAFTTSSSWSDNELYASDPLWDGYQCEFARCTGAPWFSVQLPTYTDDPIEVRICGDESTANENIPINLLEIYVQ